jgi:nicotinamidase-related amidase
MATPKTLLELADAKRMPAKLPDAAVMLIDMQNEYLSGPVAAIDAQGVTERAKEILTVARTKGAPIFHVVHKGRAGSLFDLGAERGQIISSVRPLRDEPIIEKLFPNAFAGTDLHARLSAIRQKNLILAGFATHMCISSTARAAIELGYRVTVVADACAARDLPDGQGGLVPGAAIHQVALIELADRFATIVRDSRELH